MKSDPIDRRQLGKWTLVTCRESAWAPLAIVAFYLVALSLNLYELYPELDIPTHIAGGAAITYFFRSAIRNSQDFLGAIPYPIQILFAFTATASAIIFWEFYENILDYFFKTQTVLGLFDTLKDMFNGLLGALVLTLFYRR